MMTFTTLKRKTGKDDTSHAGECCNQNKVGSCPNLVDIPKLPIPPELNPIEEQPHDNVVHRNGSGKADGLSH
jgi:hypothetical protein